MLYFFKHEIDLKKVENIIFISSLRKKKLNYKQFAYAPASAS